MCAACAATGEANARLDAGRRSARRAAELGKLLAVVGVTLGAGIIALGVLFGALVFVYLHGVGADFLVLRVATILFLSVGVVTVTFCIRKFRRIHRSGE